ncbi:MAG: hypothetical protein WD342_17570 [Verrucomicrobiales bacterium]
MRTFLLLTAFCSVAALQAADEAEVIEAYRSGDLEAVIAGTENLEEESELKNLRIHALQRRGENRFFEADIERAIADFDAVIAIDPDRDPHHWQRGLAYYYAEEYKKGKAQFERHQAVNSQDVENAVWHFLCAVRAPGGDVESAREDLIPITGDARVPMKEVHDLFAGRGTVDDVLRAAEPDDGDGDGDGEALSDRERNHLCYAHLYLGLYFEATGDEEKSANHIRKAAWDYAMDHYMGRTAKVHATVRGIGKGE